MRFRSPQRAKGRTIVRPRKNWKNWFLRPRFLGFLKIDSYSIFLFQLPNPLLQELPLWFLLGQGQSFLVRGPSLSCPAEPAVHIRAGGMRQVIICQFAMLQHRVDMRQTGLWTIAHGNCHGTIELYNWRRLNSQQSVV